MFECFVEFVRKLYGTNDPIPLHEPRFIGNERSYVANAIESTFVSSVGCYVDQFEAAVAEFVGAKHAIATVNGTSALHIALIIAGVKNGDEVITQSLTFVATCNAVRYCNANPVFVDIDRRNLGLCPLSLQTFLELHADVRDDGVCWNKKTNKPIRACVPMHSFGQVASIKRINEICKRYNIVVVEDAAEALGSFADSSHAGTIGELGVLSFNGNKIITSGGGGMILTNDGDFAARAKHLSTTAKNSLSRLMAHDEIGFNYRMPNLNAALGLAQMEHLQFFLQNKRSLSAKYADWCQSRGLEFVTESDYTSSNYWLNSIIFPSLKESDAFIDCTQKREIMTRRAWMPMHQLPMFSHCQYEDLQVTEFVADRLVNIPSSVVSSER